MINENRFSVLAFPDTLNFYLNDQGGCKQEIQLFNMHDFTINFKVLCTSVDNYNVDPAFGSVRGGHHINIQIQLKNHDFDRKKDIFKIDAYSKENNKIVGEKEIVAHILLEKPADDEEVTQSRSEELKAAKSDESLHRSASKQKPSGISSTAAAVPVANLENMVIISTNRFCFYIILVFLFGMAFEHFRRQYDEFDGSGFHNSSYDDSL